MPLQLGDIYKTHGSTKKLHKNINYKPKIKLQEGLNFYYNWAKNNYKY